MRLAAGTEAELEMPVAVLKIKEVQKDAVFAQVHLKAKTMQKSFDEIRSQQIQALTTFFSQNYKEMPVLIGGDFNDTPESVPIQLMKHDYVDLFLQD